MYGVFKNEFCGNDKGRLIHIADTEEKADYWMTSHCIPGGATYYTVERLPEVKPSRVAREEDIELGYVWELESGLFVVLNVDEDDATLSLRISKSDGWWLDDTKVAVYTDDEGSYDWDPILDECEQKMEAAGWVLLDDDKAKLNEANEITDIWGREL